MTHIQTPEHPVAGEAWSRPEREILSEALQAAFWSGAQSVIKLPTVTMGNMLTDDLRRALRQSVTNPAALLEMAETVAQHFQDSTPCGKIFTDFLLALDGYVRYEQPADEPSREG